ncbi:TPA: hypothetical protein N0F65_006204 [Lagenidium giganteum]|uniref:Protein kinase domain-containing protein n=1 Tax=Lagenidium giganteum TaxID=4803 RepID=A0AAV2Z9Z0_9STRA|nr:TPA: hypothetical protein N0F65_006204 [Lagenidium giganteum]
MGNKNQRGTYVSSVTSITSYSRAKSRRRSENSGSSKERSSITTSTEIPVLFTTFRRVKYRWNLCGTYDPKRRVDVVTVRAVKKRVDGRTLFVDKCISLLATSTAIQFARNEVEIMTYVQRYAEEHIGTLHANIVHLFGYYNHKRNVHVVMEYCEFGSVYAMHMDAHADSPRGSRGMDQSHIQTPDDAKDFMRQVSSGVAFLHATGVAHCDLALENVYLTQTFTYKVGDFEHATFVGVATPKHKLRYAAPPCRVYGAPELFCPDGESREVDMFKADVWALGAMLFMLLTREPLMEEATLDNDYYKEFVNAGIRGFIQQRMAGAGAACLVEVTEDMLLLFEGMLAIDPRQRWSAADIVACSWLKSTGSILD